jgi:hypothetical protein
VTPETTGSGHARGKRLGILGTAKKQHFSHREKCYFGVLSQSLLKSLDMDNYPDSQVNAN